MGSESSGLFSEILESLYATSSSSVSKELD
jgi:hypothetical protein